MKITKFDRTNLRLIADYLKTALASVEEKYGITFTYKGARFTASNATFKIEGITIGTDGVAVSKERQDFLQYHSLFNLPKEVLDQEVDFAGDVFVVTGLNTRSQKYPVTAKRVSDGKGFKLGADGVRNSWERKNKVIA
jgi:hypothetical protein